MILTTKVKFTGFRNPEDVMDGVMLEAADIVIDNIEILMKSGKSGRIYGSHQASAEGEAPANWTGKLLSEFESDMIDSTSAIINNSLAVEGPGNYGYILQEHRNRPIIEPALEMSEKQIDKLIDDRIKLGWIL